MRTHDRHFYPRSPRGERRIRGAMLFPLHIISIHAPREGSDFGPGASGLTAYKFLSTLPARGATSVAGALVLVAQISIHAPREGSDP